MERLLLGFLYAVLFLPVAAVFLAAVAGSVWLACHSVYGVAAVVAFLALWAFCVGYVRRMEA